MEWFRSLVIDPVARLLHDPAPREPAIDQAEELQRRHGLVLVADGIGGFDLCGLALRSVMRAEGVPYAVDVFRWGHGLGRWHADLSDQVNRDTKAQLIAETIRRFKTDHPEAPAFLVGKSGGCGVVVKALELLDQQSMECVILLAPAVSPAYDLSRALCAVRREMVVFWSPLDIFILGAGTRIFGTIDRVRSVSSGLVGFRIPGDGSERGGSPGYSKLRQVRWRPEMMATGYFGGHLGPDSPLFLRKYVVPLLRVEESPRC
jgi:Serine aminopeptidase, S33